MCKAIFSLSVSICTSETSCMKGTTVHVKNIVYTCMLYNSSVIMNKVQDFAMAFWVQIDFLASWKKRPLAFSYRVT